MLRTILVGLGRGRLAGAKVVCGRQVMLAAQGHPMIILLRLRLDNFQHFLHRRQSELKAH